jgi:hypothetical protein
MRDAKYFEEYSNNNVVFYFLINKNLDQKNSLSKLAFAIQRDKENKILKTEIFDAEDKKIKIPKGLEKFLEISKLDAPKRPMGLMSKLKFGFASEEEVLSLMNDESWDVRWEVARRIGSEGGAFAIEHLPKMMNDKNPDVRHEVANRIGVEHLPKMMNDENYYIRSEVARRIGNVGGTFAIEHLPKMMNDESWEVRWEVAKRISIEHLPKMMNDESYNIRREVAKRMKKLK